MLIVLVYGIYLITVGQFTIGLLIRLSYVTRFYDPSAPDRHHLGIVSGGACRLGPHIGHSVAPSPICCLCTRSEAKPNDALLTFRERPLPLQRRQGSV